MQIYPINQIFYNPKFNISENKRGFYPKFAPLPYDTVSFGAMKKSRFEGVDLAVVNRFKAPIEKFNTNEDFQNWCGGKIEEIKEKEFGGRCEETDFARKEILAEWVNCINKNNYPNSIALIILDSITKDLKSTNDALPPVLAESRLTAVIHRIKGLCSSNASFAPNFNKIYTNEIRDYYSDGVQTGWIKVEGERTNPDEIEENVQRLKVLSHKTWCTTRDSKAERRLRRSDVHIYLENGAPKVCIILKNGEVTEIQGEQNNWRIPLKYYDLIKQRIEEENLKIGKGGKELLLNAEKAKILLEKSKIMLKEEIANEDYKGIFEYFEIEHMMDENGNIFVFEPPVPDSGFSFSDLGLDEKRLMEKVTVIPFEED